MVATKNRFRRPGRPRRFDQDSVTRYTLMLPEDQRIAIDRVAEERQLSASDVVREILREGLASRLSALAAAG